MLKTLLPTPFVALFALACSSSSFAEGPSPAAAPSAGDFRYQKSLTGPAKLEVHDQNGSIIVEPAAGDTLEIVAVKTGRREDLARVQVVAREEGGTIVVCAVWPGQDASRCSPGAAPSGTGDDVRVRVDFRVRLPSKVTALDARTMNGAIVARSTSGAMALHTLNGSIDVTANGPITAETMNGAIVARASAGHAVQLTTKNGKVEVVLAPTGDADIQASTLNGRVTSELGDVPPPAIPGIHDVKLRLGAGGTPVTLRTLNGNVAVRRGG